MLSGDAENDAYGILRYLPLLECVDQEHKKRLFMCRSSHCTSETIKGRIEGFDL